MLDTNTVSYILRGQSLKARKRIEHLSEEEEVCISAISEGEIRYGLAKHAVKHETRDNIERFLEATDILPWDSDVARVYGFTRAKLETAGRPINNLDLLIASHAMTVEAVLVTNDRTFRNLGNNLRTISWATDLPVRVL
jgi:tRNA(fMet)-specific endonuclease VapC